MLLSKLNLLATAPGGVARLRELILTLAVQGKLVAQDPSDEPASELLKKISVEKDRLMAAGQIKRDKPLAEIADEEKPFGLPSGWQWVRFGDLALISSGVTLGRKTPIGSPLLLPYLRVANVQRWHVKLASMKDVVIDRTELDRFQLVNGDLLITEGGDWDKVGRTAIWRDELPICLHQNHVFKVRGTSAEWNPHWAQLFLNSPVARAYFAFSAKQTTNLASINMTELKHCVFPLPPLAEQSRIVTRVEELMRLCDALEAKGQLEIAQHAQLVSTLLGTLTDSDTPAQLAENWQRMASHFDLLLDRPQAVDALEQTILQLAVRGLLVPQDPQDEPASALLQKIRKEKDRLIAQGQIKRDKPLPPIAEDEQSFALPPGWDAVRFGDYFFELCTGPFGSMVHKQDYVAGGVPLINPSHMIGGRISHDPTVSVSLAMSEKLSVYRLTAGDLVLARRGEVGRYALVTDDEDGWLCGTGSFFVKLHEACSREFLGLILEDPDLRTHLLGESVGSTMTNLNQRILIETPIALPPLAEQSRIVTRVAALRQLCADLRARLSTSQATQAQLAEALVDSVGSGVPVVA
ncbi:restriction endonuclease subunit S [Rhodoferax sp. 4810]|nr:restriction endonuclease subunit S [Rhodoferax jenense]